MRTAEDRVCARPGESHVNGEYSARRTNVAWIPADARHSGVSLTARWSGAKEDPVRGDRAKSGRRPNEGTLILAILKRRNNSQKFEQALRRPLMVVLETQAEVAVRREIGAMEESPAHIALVTRGFVAIIFG